MDIVKELIELLDGEYESDGIKKGHTPSGAFIMHNSCGVIKRKDYAIKIYNFDDMGVRAVNTLDGSPFKIVLILPFPLNKSLTVFPKTFFQKIFGDAIPKATLSLSAKGLLKKYSIKGNKQLSSYILSDSLLTEIIPKHILYITTSIQKNNTTMSLRPNESVVTAEELRVLFNIMDCLGKIIIEHKSILKK